jgi:ABC-type transporter Mla subunit MlaD
LSGRLSTAAQAKSETAFNRFAKAQEQAFNRRLGRTSRRLSTALETIQEQAFNLTNLDKAAANGFQPFAALYLRSNRDGLPRAPRPHA